MQMKNVNLLQSNSEAVETQHSGPLLAPPLPPRANTATSTCNSTSIQGQPLQSSGGSPTVSAITVHDNQNNSDEHIFNDDVPMPKPIPPPYRQPPFPAAGPQYASVGYGVVGAATTSRLNNEPVSCMSPPVPGSSDPDPIYVTHSAKFPIRRDVTRPPHGHQHGGSSSTDVSTKGGTSRIPHLSEVFRRQQQRARMANTVTPDTGVQHRAQQAWTREEKPMTAAASAVTVENAPMNKQTHDDGEPLLIQARSDRSGLDNYGVDINGTGRADETCYVPSQPHQRPSGSFARGQLLLERRPETAKNHGVGDENTLYRAQFVTSGVETSNNGSRIYASANSNPVRAIHSSMQNLKGSMLSIHSAAGRLQLDGGSVGADGESIYATRAEVTSNVTAVLPPPQQFCGASPSSSTVAETVHQGGRDSSVQSAAYDQSAAQYGRYYHLKDMLSGQSEGVSVDDDPSPPSEQHQQQQQQQPNSRSHTSDRNQAAKVEGEPAAVKRGAIYGLLRQIVMPSVKNIAQKFESSDQDQPVVVNQPSVTISALDKSTDNQSAAAAATTTSPGDVGSQNEENAKPALPARSAPTTQRAEWTDTVEYELRQILGVKLQKPLHQHEHEQQQHLPPRSKAPAHDQLCHGSVHESTFSDSFSVTPPLPPLSPPGTPPSLAGSRSPGPRSNSKYRLSQSAGNLHKTSGTTPDILETTRKGPFRETIVTKSRHGAAAASMKSSNMKSSSAMTGSSIMSQQQSSDIRSWSGGAKRYGAGALAHFRVPLTNANPSKTFGGRPMISVSRGGQQESHDGEVTSTTTGLDMDSLLGDGDLSTDISSQTSQTEEPGEMRNIRRQLESLETMYAEVMRMLGVKGGPRMNSLAGHRSLHDLRPSRRKVFGSVTSLSAGGKGVSAGGTGRVTQSSKDSSRINEKKPRPRESKGIARRFQRLESHVVTLARSVAHLSSEMRTQHLMFQEMDSLRQEVARLSERQQQQQQQHQRGAVKMNGCAAGGREWDNFRSSIPSLTNPTRVKKLTKFFGDEPPLLRLFLKKLGYEKYAPQFESEKIGIIELPYLTEERLQKIGIPTGPRMRILQEAQMSFRQEHFNIYIV